MKKYLLIIIILLPTYLKAQLITKFPIYDTLVTQIENSNSVTSQIEIYQANGYVSAIDSFGVIYNGFVAFDGAKGVVVNGVKIKFPNWKIKDKSMKGKIIMAN